MHILVTADTIGGVWTYTRELVPGLIRRGLKVTLVSFGDIPRPEQTEWMDGLAGLDYRPTAFKLEWMQDCEPDLAASADYLLSIVRETKPDLLHLSQFYYGALPCNVPRVVVAHSDVVGWWREVRQQEPPESDWTQWYRAIVSRGIAKANAVVAPSKWMLEQVAKHYVTPLWGLVVFNGRNPLLFNPHLSKDELILTVGRIWDSGKNTGLLLQQEMPAPVTIAGSDHHPESKGAAPDKKDARYGIHFEPHQNEKQLCQLFARAPIYAATSRYEPFGLAPLEAALSRCALVASDIAPFRELWEGAAVFFRNNDAQSLRQALEPLIAEPELRIKYANLAYNHARQKFNAERMVDDYVNVYNALAPVAAMTA
ncbi:MAG TPA: glycosyltransferase family 4 protein [Candidatus Angelobacter sp.]|jgi:glycosyltransferase involved in cell wall biosynthesis|nr:glycosyltransferase family 4 protein [Candidatus Angelobacter sp.]